MDSRMHGALERGEFIVSLVPNWFEELTRLVPTN